MTPNGIDHRLPAADLEAFVARAFIAVGLFTSDAERVAWKCHDVPPVKFAVMLRQLFAN
jgi:hypothetical protein